jgi:hypothetical protein
MSEILDRVTHTATPVAKLGLCGSCGPHQRIEGGRTCAQLLPLHVTGGGALVAGTTSARVRAYRARLRAQGLRPIQIWVPDVNAVGFAEEAHRQSRAVAGSRHAEADQTFVDSVSDWPED